MRTLIINGSPRAGGDTEALIDALTSHLKGEYRITSYRDGFSPCIDCRLCWDRFECFLDDGMDEVFDYYQEADNLVLAAPIWFSSLSGPLLNLASRAQMFYVAKTLRGETPIPKRKNGALLMVGAEKGTEMRPRNAAHAIFKHMNALPCVAEVYALNTNEVPARFDEKALREAREAAELLNKMCRD